MVLANPSGRLWDCAHNYTIDDAYIGDAMRGTWHIWTEGNTGLGSSEHMETSITMLRTIATRAENTM